jgi:hypothetical protein
MKIRFLTQAALLAVLPLSSLWAAHHEKTVVFPKFTVSPGMSYTEERYVTRSAKGSFFMDDQELGKLERLFTIDEEKTVTLLDLIPDGYRVAKARVDVDRSLRLVDTPPSVETPIHGKSYILFIDDSGMDPLPADPDTSLTEMEKEILRRDFSNLHDISFFPQFLRGRTVKVGDELDIPISQAGELIGFQQGLNVMDAYMVLQGTREYEGREVAEFSVHTELTGKVREETLEMEVSSTGTLYVDLETSFPVHYRMVGQMVFKLPDSEKGLTFNGSGSLVLNISRDYDL